jgi:hypothetical protein
MRVAGSVPLEQHDGSQTGDRRYVSAASTLEHEAMNVAIETIAEAKLTPEFTAA